MNDTILIFDGRCGFCTRSVEWALPRLRRPVRALPYQAIDLGPWGITEDQASKAAWVVTPAGKKKRGHLAVAHTLLALAWPWPIVGALLLVPPIRWAAALGYHLVAANRSRFPGTTPACKKPWDLERGRPA